MVNAGPDLPSPRNYHCMVNLNETGDQSEDIVAIIGGFEGETSRSMISRKVLIYNHKMEAKSGPPLIHYRAGHACTIFR